MANEINTYTTPSGKLYDLSLDEEKAINNAIELYMKTGTMLDILKRLGKDVVDDLITRYKQSSEKDSADGTETLIEIALGTNTAPDLFTGEIAKYREVGSLWRITRATSISGERSHVLAIKLNDVKENIGTMWVAFATGGKVGWGAGFPVYSYSGITQNQFNYLLRHSANPGRWLYRNRPKANDYIGQVSFVEIERDVAKRSERDIAKRGR